MEKNKTFNVALNILTFAIGVVGLILSLRIMAGYEDVVSSALWMVYILMIVAAGVAILFGIFGLITNLKRNIPLLIGLAGFAIIALIAYGMGSDEVIASYGPDITPQVSLLSDMGVIMSFILIGIAVLIAIVGEIARFFK